MQTATMRLHQNLTNWQSETVSIGGLYLMGKIPILLNLQHAHMTELYSVIMGWMNTSIPTRPFARLMFLTIV